MAGKTLFPTEGAPPGISAGAPFVVNEFTYVEQVTPPFLATSRLGRIADSTQSIIAPGPNNSAHSTVLGEGAADSVGVSSAIGGGPMSVVIGYQVTQSPDVAPGLLASSQVLIGAQINMAALPFGNNQGLVAIGTPSFTTFAGTATSFGGSVVIGYTAKLTAVNAAGGDATNAVAIGFAAQAIGQAGVAIGANAVAANDAVSIGDQSRASGSGSFPQAIAIGAKSSAQQVAAIAIGYIAKAGDNSIVIGQSADSTGATSSLAIGRDTNVTGLSNAMAFGRECSPGTNGMALFGSVNYPLSAFRFGGGVNNSAGAVTYTLGVTDVFGGAGANVAGNGLVIQAGHGLGNWPNTQNLGIDLQVGKVQAAGSTIQPYTSVLGIRHSDLNVSLWGGLSAPFSGGAGVLFMANATTAPTAAAIAGGGIMYATGGQLHWLSSAGVDYAITPTGGGGGITGGGTAARLAGFTGATAIGSVPLTYTATVIGTPADDTIDLGTAANNFNHLYVNIVACGNGDLQFQTFGKFSYAVGGVAKMNLTSTELAPNGGAALALGAAGAPFTGLFLDGASPITLTSATTTVGASAGTFTNAPAAGNPVGYLRVNINGSLRAIPFW